MQTHFSKALVVALALGPVTTPEAAKAQNTSGVMELTRNTALGRPPGNVMFPGGSFIPHDSWFPGGTDGPFAPEIVRAFARHEITTIGDMASADAKLVGRILEIDPRQAQALQRHLRENLSRR